MSRLCCGGFCIEQRVNGTPSLLVNSCNKFLTLDVEEADDHTMSKDMPKKTVQPNVQHQNWEQRLPQQYMMAGTEGQLSLKLQVQLQTTDTREKFGLQALVDSRASGLFIDSDYVQQSKIATKSLS